jgi:sulfur relay (sulfurtransferase) DsrC/TusE family protein
MHDNIFKRGQRQKKKELARHHWRLLRFVRKIARVDGPYAAMQLQHIGSGIYQNSDLNATITRQFNRLPKKQQKKVLCKIKSNCKFSSSIKYYCQQTRHTLWSRYQLQVLRSAMRSGIECLKRNRKNSHQQPLPGSLGKTGRAKAGENIPLNQ